MWIGVDDPFVMASFDAELSVDGVRGSPVRCPPVERRDPDAAALCHRARAVHGRQIEGMRFERIEHVRVIIELT